MNKNTSFGLAVAITSVLTVVGCEDKNAQPPLSEPKPAMPTNNTAAVPTANPPAAGGVAPVSPDAANLGSGQTITSMGVSVTLPEGWKRNPPANQMRLAEANVPDASGDPAKACLVVFSTAGGSVSDNISRWAGQVRDAQGQPVAGTPATKQVGGVNVTTVEMTGTFAGMGDTPAQGELDASRRHHRDQPGSSLHQDDRPRRVDEGRPPGFQRHGRQRQEVLTGVSGFVSVITAFLGDAGVTPARFAVSCRTRSRRRRENTPTP